VAGAHFASPLRLSAANVACRVPTAGVSAGCEKEGATC